MQPTKTPYRVVPMDNQYGYQHGQDAAKGDVTAEPQFNEKFPNEAEAQAEYERGFREQQDRIKGIVPPLD